ncbi:MAG: MerR family transcriptional regulator [Bryobacterales bacterium]|nr:MerR family transcriptional regulator [Bryobacterales bacterium]
MANVALKPTPSVIPNKLYFRIGEVSRIAGVKPHVLRYWETEFAVIDPKKSGAGHRLYRRRDVELILEIKYLLYEKRYTIEGARAALGRGRNKAVLTFQTAQQPVAPASQTALFESPAPPPAAPPVPTLAAIRSELEAILALLG